MHFLLAANERLKTFALQCTRSLEKLGYKWTMYDLGGLGFGEPYFIQDETFRNKGFYQTSYKRYPSKGMHKPQMIADFLNTKRSNQNNQLVVYLDVDALVRDRIDEIDCSYDIGVTVRRPAEWKSGGKVNAGVIFIRSTESTRMFLNRWVSETQRFGNDQVALNALLTHPNCSVGEFSCDVYNWYYFPESPPPEAKILHFKASSKDDRIPREQAWKSVCSSL